jgi:RNA polymerase sigma-70 factor (ECF subfamily)
VTGNEREWLAQQFEESRSHLRAVAWRMLGSSSDADDAVQEAWLRLSRSDTSAVHNLRAWLTTVVARVCLDMLRSRKSRGEVSLDTPAPEAVTSREDRTHPEHEAQLADAVGLALLVVLETLAPAERVAFVLHDLFDLPFEEIAPVVGRTPAAARQLASRARRRVRGAGAPETPDPARQRQVVEAFLAASQGGDLEALLVLLDPDVVLRADPAAAQMGAPKEVRGAADVARTFSGRARAAQLALVNGLAGLAWAPGGRPRVVFGFTTAHGKVVAIDMVADAAWLSRLKLRLLGRPSPSPGQQPGGPGT